MFSSRRARTLIYFRRQRDFPLFLPLTKFSWCNVSENFTTGLGSHFCRCTQLRWGCFSCSLSELNWSTQNVQINLKYRNFTPRGWWKETKRAANAAIILIEKFQKASRTQATQQSSGVSFKGSKLKTSSLGNSEENWSQLHLRWISFSSSQAAPSRLIEMHPRSSQASRSTINKYLELFVELFFSSQLRDREQFKG